ncbi:TPA: hypothetical protein ACU3BL_003576 [Salmonella enterica]|nr:hypothetical protein [Salmonella enterica subsp. enterica serovar Amager]
MNVWFKVGAISLAIAIIGGIITHYGNNQMVKYEDRNSLVQENKKLNGKFPLWHMNPVKENKDTGTKDVSDAQGTVFKNIPDGTSDIDFLKHFASRDEWKEHSFFGDDFFDFSSVKVGGTWAICENWQKALTNARDDTSKIDPWDLTKTLTVYRNKYIQECAWLNYKDMDYQDKEATIGYELGQTLSKLWWLYFALFGTVPAIWISFWRLVGMAYRSARKGMKGDY